VFEAVHLNTMYMFSPGAAISDQDVVSFGDLEQAGATMYDRVAAWRAVCVERLGSPAYRFSFGAIVLLYGGHFKTLTVIWSSLQNVSWDKVRVDFEEAVQMYHRSRTQLCEYAGGEESVSAMAVEDVAQLGATVAAMNSRPLLDMFIRLQQSLIAQVACALNANTMQFTAGLDLSRRASSIIGSSVEACLLDKEDSGRDAVRRRAKLRLLTDGICTIVGVSAVWSLRGVAALWTSCTVGAGLCVKALGDWQGDISEPAVVFTTSLAMAGFLYQVQYGGRPPLPLPVAVVATPLMLMEFGVNSLS